MIQPTYANAIMKCFYRRECVLLEDRISDLPDDILILIISHLKLREAARTSVLSHRWRFIWTFTNGVLDFVNNKSVSSETTTTTTTTTQNTLLNDRSRFLEWVNLVLQRLHNAATIEEFRVSINIGVGNSEVLDTWINFALQRHAKILRLELGRYMRCFQTYPKDSLREHVFISNSNNNSSLTTLHLESLEVTGEVLGYMLSCFPLLQVLYLYRIDSLVELKIVGPSPSLKCLTINDCFDMRSLEVYAVNLVSFTYRGPEITKIFKQVSSLVEADVCDVFLVKNIRQFSTCFSRLESLSLHLSLLWEQMVEDFPKLPKFNKLSYLYLSMATYSVNRCLSHCSKLLKASPALHRFVLRMSICGKIETGIKLRTSRKAIYQHTQLKVIEFISFRGCGKHADLVHRLLVKVPSLEKIVIHPERTSVTFKQPWKAIETAQMLQNSFFPAVKLVIAAPEAERD